jgi:hypothetical protein
LKHYISLGAGVQSSCMALMAAHGEISPIPDGAIFADTQAEPKQVYEWLDWLESKLPFPVHRVSKGSLTKSALTPHVSKKGGTYYKTAIPFHTISPEGSRGMVSHRSCTVDYKIKPIVKELRRLTKPGRPERRKLVTSWIGISLDEMQRMKPAREHWIENRWPLIEMRMTRHLCLEWMRNHGYPEPPRSACVFCPFRSNAEWRHLKLSSPDGFQEAVRFDREARAMRDQTNWQSKPFVHRSCKPLDEVDLRNDVDHGQKLLWGDECTGMCGV